MAARPRIGDDCVAAASIRLTVTDSSFVAARLTQAVLAVVLAGACAPAASYVDPLENSGVTSHTPKLDSAVRAYSRAYYGGQEGRAFALLSAHCRRRLGHKSFAHQESIAARRFGRQPAPTIHVSYRYPKARALLAYQYPTHRLDVFRAHWVYEHGWKNDAC